MTEIFNQKDKTKLRRKLRSEMPSAEKVLWKYLRKKQINNYRFRRQVSIGKFVVDFYCPELNLIIEVDGANHGFTKESENYDKIREDYFKKLKLNILRFSNSDIYHNISNVLEVVYNFARVK